MATITIVYSDGSGHLFEGIDDSSPVFNTLVLMEASEHMYFTYANKPKVQVK